MDATMAGLSGLVRYTEIAAKWKVRDLAQLLPRISRMPAGQKDKQNNTE